MKKKYLIIFFLILFLHGFVLSKMIFFPYPEFFVNPYLVNQGLKPYQQIMDQHAPGLMFFPINFSNLGMTTPQLTRIWLISIVLITQVILFVTSLKLFKDFKKALLVNLLYLIWQPFFEGTTFWIDSILPIFFCTAFYLSGRIIEEEKKQDKKLFFLTGLTLGVAVIFKQVALPLAFLLTIYFYFRTRSLKAVSIFLAAFLTPILFTIYYFHSIGVLKDFWYWTVIFNLTTFAEYGKKLAPALGYYTRIALVFLMPILALFFRDKKITTLLFIFLLGSLLGAFARFDFIHFQPALPFAVIGTILGFEKIYQKKYLKLLIILYLLIAGWWMTIFYKGHLSKEIILYDKETVSIANKIKQYTIPGEKIFILGAPLHLYQITQTLPAGDIFYIQAPWYVMIAGNKTLDGIKRDNPRIVVLDQNLVFEGNKIIDYAKNIYQYLIGNYHQIDQVGTVQIMSRNSP